MSGFVLSKEPGAAVARNYSWQAFPRGSSITAICVTPWGDLWVGNNRGSIRSLLPTTLQGCRSLVNINIVRVMMHLAFDITTGCCSLGGTPSK